MAQSFNLTAQINLQAPSNLKTIVSQIRREFGTVSADVKLNISAQSARSIDNIRTRLDAMNASLIQARNNTTALDSALRNLSASLSSVQSNTSKTDNSFTKTAASVGQTAKNIKAATTEMEEFGKQSALAIRRFAAFSVVTSGVFALINAVNSGFKAFVEFDKELVKLQQVTGRGEIGLRSLEKEISSLSTTLGVSSKSLIEVASTLAQAGLSADDTRVALAALAKTELAPSFDNLTDTTEGAIAAIRQFGLEAGDLEKALGSINAVAAAFAVESRDIIAAIQRTGGVFAASSKGVSEGTDALNEFIAVFTSIRQTTRESAETIATGLRTIFTRIQRAKTIDQLKEYGVTLTDLEGKFVGPFEAVKRLSTALSQLDPRDLRFSSIVEELGGFRQIGKVIPLIQQFKTAQDALSVAQKGQGSLYDAQVTAQKSLANQLAKVREQFLALIRDIGKSQSFQALFKIVTGLASGLISLASAFKPILPILAIMGAVKGVSAIRQFGSGFMGGISRGGGARGVGSNVGETLSGAKDKEREQVTSRASDAIRENTSALRLLTDATNKLSTSVVKLDDSIRSRPSGAAGLNSGGIVRKFARGGVVPGSGNGDTVPAMLEPGEFVIRKKAVATIGADKLHKMNRYADGGIAKETKVGVAVLDAKNEISGSDEYAINKGDFSKYAKTTDRRMGLKYLPKGRGYTVVRETLDDKLKPLFNQAIDTGIVSGLEKSLSELGSEYEIPLPLSSASAQAFLKGINDATRGNVFESMLTALSTNGNFDPDANPQAPFDYVGGFKGKLGSSKLFQTIKDLNYIDAKASEEQSQAKNIAPKILLQLFKENQSASNTTGGSLVDKINSIKDQLPNEFRSEDIQKLLGKSTGIKQLLEQGIIEATPYNSSKYKLAAQNFAAGGIAKAPLVDDILQASGSILPKPSAAIEALIRAGGGAIDIDRTLKRTIGDKAYSKAPGSSKEAVLSKYFRDDQVRLSDITSSPLTGFGKELLEAIGSKQLDAKKLSIISKSKRTKGVAEYFNQLFGIPIENMVFTQGGDKQPALDAIRTKGPRTDRVRKFLGGIIQKLKLGGEVYDLQNGTGLSNPEFDSLVQFANTNDFSMDEFKAYLAKRIQEKKNKSGLMMNPTSLLRAITPETQTASQKQLDLANMLKGEVDAKFNPKYDNARKPFAVGGSVEDTVPALLTPGEFVINKKAAKTIGYAKLHRMNQADKIQGYNKGGAVGGVQRFAAGGVPSEPQFDDANKAITDVLESLPKEIQDVINTTMDKMPSELSVVFGDSFDEINKKLRQQLTFAISKADELGTEAVEGIRKALGASVKSLDKAERQQVKVGSAAKATSGDISGPDGTAGVSERTLQNILKVLIAQEKNTRTSSGQELINTIEETIGKQASGAINAGEAIVDVAAGIRKLAIESRGSGDEDRAQSLKRVFDSLDKIRQGKGGSSLIDATNARLGMEVSKPIADQFSAFRSAQGGPVADTMGPRTPVPESMMRFTTAAKVATEEQMSKERQTYADDQFLKYRAQQSGSSEAAVRLELAQKIGKRSYENEQFYGGKVTEAQSGLVTRRDSAMKIGSSIEAAKRAALNATTDEEKAAAATQLADANSRLTAETEAVLQQMIELRPDLAATQEGMEQLSTGAKQVAQELSTGDLKKAQDALAGTVGNKLTQEQARSIAIKQTAKESNVDEEFLTRQFGSGSGAKLLKRQEFIQSREGQRFGMLSEFAPDMLSKFSGSRAGKAVGGAADFISGKGGKFSQAFGRMGGITGIGTGVAVAADQAKQFLPASMQKDPNVQGALGALGGAGSGAASGAMLGAQVAGPVGALIAGIGGAVIGGIDGWFAGKNQQVLTNALDSITKSSGDLDAAFKKLDQSVNKDNFGQAQKAFGNLISNTGKLSDIAFAEGPTTGGMAASGLAGAAGGAAIGAALGSIVPILGTALGAAAGAAIGGIGGAYANYRSAPTKAERQEALQASISTAGSQQEAASRLAETRLQSTSTEDIDNIIKSLNNGFTSANPIVQQYAESIAASTGKSIESVEAQAKERASLDAFMKARKEAGATDEAIAKEIEANRGKAKKEGEQILNANALLIAKQSILARATKEVAVATENLLDVYRRVNANIQRYESELDQTISNMDGMIGNLTGNSKIPNVNRQNEQVLGNLSAYSADEVRAAASNTAGLLGGTPEANSIASTASAAKILQDQLPAMLRNVEPGQDQSVVVDQLRDMFKEQGMSSGAIDGVLKEIEDKINQNTTTDGKSIGTLIDEIDSGILGKFSQTAQEGANTLKNLAQTYNNTLQRAIDIQNEYNKVIMESNSYMRKAQTIRINAELDLAQALGKNPTLKEMNKAFDAEVNSLTSGLVASGDISPDKSADPFAILEGIRSATFKNENLKLDNVELQNRAGGLTDSPDDQKARKDLNQKQLDNIAIMGKNNAAIEESRQALEKLATDGSKAANALSKIKERQQLADNARGLARRLLTSDSGELADISRQGKAFNKVIQGRASEKELNSLQTRRDAFAGLDNIKSVLPESVARKMEAQLTRQMLQGTADGRKMLGMTFGKDSEGKSMTLDDALKNAEDGKDPVQEKYIAEYQRATDVQIQANEALAMLNQDSALLTQETMLKLQDFLNSRFPEIVSKAFSDARTDAQAKPTPETKTKQEERKNRETQKQATEKEQASLKAKQETLLKEAEALERERFKNQEIADKGGQGSAVAKTKAKNLEAERDKKLAEYRENQGQVQANEDKMKMLSEQETGASSPQTAARIETETGVSAKPAITNDPTKQQIASVEEQRRVLAERWKKQQESRKNLDEAQAKAAASATSTAQTEASVASATSPQVYGSSTRVDRTTELKNKGKLRVGEDGLPIGRSPEEEKEFKDRVALKYKNRSLLANLPEYSRKVKSGEMTQEEYDAKLAEYKSNKDKIEQQRKADEQRNSTPSGAMVAGGTGLSPANQAGMQRMAEDFVANGQQIRGRTDTRGRPLDFSNYSYSNPTYEEIKAAEARGDYAVRPNAGGPIPTSLPTQTMPQQTGSGPQQTQQNNSSTATMITLDPTALEAMTSFNKTFGDYVTQLSSITIPDKVTISGNYTVDLKISGAAAIEALDKKIKEIGETFVSATDFTTALDGLRDEVSRAMPTAIKPSASRGSTGSRNS